MKYELHAGLHLYSPEDPLEIPLVFHVLQQKLELQTPFCVQRDIEACHEYRNGAWFAWSYYLPCRRESDNSPFVLFVDTALASPFWTADDPVVRWGSICGNPQRDEEDLRDVLRKIIDKRLRRLQPDKIWAYLRIIERAMR